MSKPTFVIVGASLAGAKAAEELRERGFDGRIVLVGTEPERPYERPPLTKDYLRGESEREKAYVHMAGFYQEHEIELNTATTATAIDPHAAKVTLDHGQELAYDRLLLATGAEPRRLSSPGADLGEIYYLRSLADCDALRERLDSTSRVAVIGAGWIGSEFAASARTLGHEVALVDPLELPNERIFGPEIGAFYRDVHAQHGIELHLGDGLEAFEGEGVVQRIRTNSGKVVECDFAVVGIGVAPRVGLARDAGLEVDNGIVVNEHLQSGTDDVFAAGDVANAWHPFFEERIRVEHWANALNQGPAAARAMLGDSAGYDRLPYSSPTNTTLAWIFRLCDELGPGRVPGPTRRRRVRRLLARGRTRAGRHERQRLGHQRARAGADPLPSTGRRGGADRCRYAARVARR